MSNDIIHLLPDSVANQIAAGEVIQRPASVVKELVENAVDAGATNIEIRIKDAGKTFIHIIDNGCGMTATDARMAFERHATSKIKCADDLFTLHTMGFRGEALPSVAAVSEVELRTMPRGGDMGTRLVIKASKVESQEPAPCNPGTSIMVKHLFFNVVVRRRFLKKDSVEFSHITHEFERLALVNTDINFLFVHNDSVVHQLLKGSLAQRIGQLFGRSVERSLIPIEAATAMVRITGFVGAPQSARVRGHLQYFFVNGRNMRHPYFHKAVLSCYKDLISGDAQPNYFINFELDPDRIDVNIHPQKNEIKFEDEQMVWQVLTAAVRDGLGKFNVGPAIDFTATDVPDIPPMQQEGGPAVSMPVDDPLDPDYNPFRLQNFDAPTASPRLFDPIKMTRRVERPSALNNSNWEKLYDKFSAGSEGEAITGLNTVPSQLNDRVGASGDEELPFGMRPEEAPTLTALDIPDDFDKAMFQLKNRWIVTRGKSGLMIIDQHRAHTRILYEQILPEITTGNMSTQHLIFPESVETDPALDSVIGEAQELLKSLGFEIERTTDRTWSIGGVPAELSKADPRNALLSIAGELADSGADPESQQRTRIALSMARLSAVGMNQPLSDQEMRRLVKDLFALNEPNYTPDGRPVVRIIGTDRIAAMFHR